MSSLSGEIERYLKQLIAEQDAGMLEIQRSVLSEHFSCVPSQINYVLSTRFTLSHGYMVETKRGGGGYVRIISVPLEDSADLSKILESLTGSVSESQGRGLLDYLTDEGYLSEESQRVLRHLLGNKALKFPEHASVGQIRAQLLRQILASLILTHSDQK